MIRKFSAFIKWTGHGIAMILLLLATVTAVFWVRSYWLGDSFTYFGLHHRVRIISLAAQIDFEFTSYEASKVRFDHFVYHDNPDEEWNYTRWDFEPESHCYFLGIEYSYPDATHPIGGGAFPCSEIVLSSLCFPTVWFWRIFRRRRREKMQGLCTKCGYNLQAHFPGEKCPECGTVIPQPKTTFAPGNAKPPAAPPHASSPSPDPQPPSPNP